MKKTIFILLLFSFPVLSQWQQLWLSGSFIPDLNSGWIYFDKSPEGWKMRLYTLDSLRFQVMEEGLSSNVAYTYYFNYNEMLAGSVISSIQHDLNGDNKTDFYTLSQYGTSNPRQSFRIFDLTSNQTIFEKNDPSWYYLEPYLIDIDSDGRMECLVIKFDYPWMTNYYYEVYRTNSISSADYRIPEKFQLLQNHPNPFNPSTTISFSLTTTDDVAINIYDLQGELVAAVLNETKQPGFYEVEWDGLNSAGKRLSSGMYLYELTVGSRRAVKKMLMLK